MYASVDRGAFLGGFPAHGFVHPRTFRVHGPGAGGLLALSRCLRLQQGSHTASRHRTPSALAPAGGEGLCDGRESAAALSLGASLEAQQTRGLGLRWESLRPFPLEQYLAVSGSRFSAWADGLAIGSARFKAREGMGWTGAAPSIRSATLSLKRPIFIDNVEGQNARGRGSFLVFSAGFRRGSARVALGAARLPHGLGHAAWQFSQSAPGAVGHNARRGRL